MSTQNKSDYKLTKLGSIPKSWNIKRLADLCDFQNGKGHEQIICDDGKFVLVNSKFVSSEGEVKKHVENCLSPLYKDDITIVMSDVPNGKAIAKCFYVDQDSRYSLNQRIGCIRPLELIDSKFLYYQLNRNKYYLKFDDGVKQTNLRKNEVLSCPIIYPPLNEQKSISAVIDLWEYSVKSNSEYLSLLNIRKKGLMQQLFSGELRLQNPSGKSFPDWKAQKLGHYLKVSKAKNLDLKYGDEDVLSVSGEFGIVNQIEFHGRSFAGASVANYGVVETGDIVYTKSPLKANPYGIIKVNKGVPGIVSTLYAIYKCKPTVNGEFVDYYFQLDDNVNRYLRPLVQKGTKNDMKINNEKVLIDKVLFPSVEEQAVIVDFFKTVDQEITETKNYLETLKTQKKGLMQKLLTGEVRVKMD